MATSDARRCACWCCWRVRRWLRQDRDERDDEQNALFYSVMGREDSGNGKARKATEGRPPCPEFVMRRSEGLVLPWRAPAQELGLPVECLRAMRDEMEELLAFVARQHAEREMPSWANDIDETFILRLFARGT